MDSKNHIFIPGEGMRQIPRKIFKNENLNICDVYIKLGNDHYLRIAKENAESNFEAYHFYQKISDVLYVEKIQYDRILKKKFADLSASFDLDYQFDKSIQSLVILYEAIYADLRELSPSPELSARIESIRPYVLRLAASNPNISNLVKIIANHMEVSGEHSFLVSMISCQIGLRSNLDVEKLADIFLGSYLHDVGFLFLPPEIYRNIKSLDKDSLNRFESHPSVGAAYVDKMIGISPAVAEIVQEHHENNFGSGYPKGLKAKDIHELSKIVALAECFVELTVGSATTGEPMSSEQAINFISNVYAQPFEEKYFELLKELVK